MTRALTINLDDPDFLTDVNGDEIRKGDIVKFYDGSRIYRVLNVTDNGKVIITSGKKIFSMNSTLLRWVR